MNGLLTFSQTLELLWFPYLFMFIPFLILIDTADSHNLQVQPKLSCVTFQHGSLKSSWNSPVTTLMPLSLLSSSPWFPSSKSVFARASPWSWTPQCLNFCDILLSYSHQVIYCCCFWKLLSVSSCSNAITGSCGYLGGGWNL